MKPNLALKLAVGSTCLQKSIYGCLVFFALSQVFFNPRTRRRGLLDPHTWKKCHSTLGIHISRLSIFDISMFIGLLQIIYLKKQKNLPNNHYLNSLKYIWLMKAPLFKSDHMLRIYTMLLNSRTWRKGLMDLSTWKICHSTLGIHISRLSIFVICRIILDT